MPYISFFSYAAHKCWQAGLVNKGDIRYIYIIYIEHDICYLNVAYTDI